MAGDDPVRICLDELRDKGGIGAARDMAEQRSVALLGLQGAASDLVVIALDSEGGERERSLDLLGALIREARKDGENLGHLGRRFLEEAAASIAMLVVEGRLEHTDALDLTNAYVLGDVDAPDTLVAFLMARLNALARAEGATGTGGLDAEIDKVRQAAEGDHDLYRVVDKWLAVFPARRKAGIVRHIAGRPEEFGGRLALYWLLDSSSEVRLAAAGGVNGRVNMRIVEPGSLSVVPLIRNWIPADAARALLDTALRESRRRGLFSPLGGPVGHPVRFLGGLPDRSGAQAFAGVTDDDDGPVLAMATIRPGHGVEQAAVVRGTHAREGIAELENGRDTVELPRKSFELLLGAAVSEGLQTGRLAPAGLIDVALACGLAELRPRAMTAQDWLDELDPAGGIPALEAAEREDLVEESAAWQDRHPMVEAWSEGTAIYRDARDEARGWDGTEAAFWARMEERREHWSLAMLRAAHVLKGADHADWRSFVATAMAVLDGRTLKAVPIMDRVYAETLAAWLREQYGRMSEDDDGTAELSRLIAAAAWPADGERVAPSVWLDGYLAAGVLSPSGAEPDALYSAAAERFCNGGDGQKTEPFLTFMANRYEELEAEYGEVRRVVAMFESADDLGMPAWAQGFAHGVRILEAGWPTEMFIAAERRMVSLLARLAEGELANLEACAEVVTFIQWRWEARQIGGT